MNRKGWDVRWMEGKGKGENKRCKLRITANQSKD
jgi:hypothetical protein